MLSVFTDVVLPTFLVAAVGALLQRWRKLPVGPLGPLVVYVLSPALVFNLMLNAKLEASVSLRVVAATLLATATLALLSVAVSRALRHDRTQQSGFLLATLFPNAGNMGLPVSLLAFGEAGLAVTSVIFVVQAALSWTAGTFVAARSAHAGWGPLREALKLPSLYAVGLALALRGLNVELPVTLDKPAELLAAAALPTMLLVLGFQLAQGFGLADARDLAAALVVRLVLAAGVGYGVTLALGLEDVAQQAVVLSAAMPAAVFTTILATQYQAQPRFVTNVVVASTLASMATLTVLVYVLQRALG